MTPNTQLLDGLLPFRPATFAERRLVETLTEGEHAYFRTQLAYTTYLERLLPAPQSPPDR